jgi:hypothetical protein
VIYRRAIFHPSRPSSPWDEFPARDESQAYMTAPDESGYGLLFWNWEIFSANADKEHRYTNADLKHRDANIFNSGIKPHSWGADL